TPVVNADGEWDKTPIEEAKLGESTGFLSDEQREAVTNWWLVAKGRANTPNWDIASTCMVGAKRGLLLVEAKAHHSELKSNPKPIDKKPSDGSERNHEQIGRAIGEANAALNKEIPGWNLSRDSHYQLANRLAWTWKLASMGIPVVLVYLGFLCATEMSDQGEPFVDCADWTRVVLGHSQGVVPEQAWGRDIKVGSASFIPLIRVWTQEFEVQTAVPPGFAPASQTRGR
ncbi:MAG: hypothetical protein WCE87_08770, partial [Candidatus Udaeobacter sp.]